MLRLPILQTAVDGRDAFLIDTANFSLDEDGIYLYEINSEGKNQDISQYGKNITINKNYLEVNPIYVNVKEVFGYSAISRNILLILSLVLVNTISITIAASIISVKTNIAIFGLLILFVEIVIAILLDRIISNSSFSKIIKGEH